MKKLIFLFALSFCGLVLVAQPKIKFTSTTHNFDTIKEVDGKVTGRLVFKNEGDAPLFITSVRPGCGCTAANYTKEAVEPGQEGFVEATYNPAGRPGKFHKSIRIITNMPEHTVAGSNGMYVFIKGFVVKRPPTKFELAGYKKGRGMFRIKEDVINMEMLNTDKKTITLQVKNFWDKPATFSAEKFPPYLTMVKSSFKKELKPEEEGTIELLLDAEKYGKYGKNREYFYFITNDSISPKKQVRLELYVTEDFSAYTDEQIKNACKIHLNATSLNFDTIPATGTLMKTITITNEGKSPLNVRKVSASNSYFTIKPLAKTEIAPGESVDLPITFNPRSRRGVMLNATIDVISNDPVNTKKSIRVKGFSKKK